MEKQRRASATCADVRRLLRERWPRRLRRSKRRHRPLPGKRTQQKYIREHLSPKEKVGMCIFQVASHASVHPGQVESALFLVERVD
jgi:hypothetical protein